MDSIKTQMKTLVEDAQGNVNYISWRFNLNLTLKSKGLYLIANEIETKPRG